MFKKFSFEEEVSGQTQIKSSVVRSIRQKLVDDYPGIEEHIDEIVPKKSQLTLIKWFSLPFVLTF
jgi:malignant T-cell-amplified sequence